MQYEPDTLSRKGNEYRSKVHSSLVISLDGTMWNWFAGGVGGRSALDYLVNVEKMSFQSAVELLSSLESKPLPVRPVPPQEPKRDYEFSLPAQSRYTDRVIKYLTGRGIDRDIIQHCIRQGTIYESYPHHNVVFVGKDESGTAKFASLRGTVPDSHFRMDQPGSDKRYAFKYIPPGCDPHYQRWAAVFEAPIDALSYVTLNRRCHISPITWDKLPCLSLSGTAPAALLQYLRNHPTTDTVYLGLDNDAAGKKGIEKIAQAIQEDPVLSRQVKHIIAMLPSPEYGKDYNEVLQYVTAEEQQNIHNVNTTKKLRGKSEENFTPRMNGATTKVAEQTR